MELLLLMWLGRCEDRDGRRVMVGEVKDEKMFDVAEEEEVVLGGDLRSRFWVYRK